MDNNSLSHTKWNCKYHIVFAPKFRRKIIYGQLKQDIANILSMSRPQQHRHLKRKDSIRFLVFLAFSSIQAGRKIFSASAMTVWLFIQKQLCCFRICLMLPVVFLRRQIAVCFVDTLPVIKYPYILEHCGFGFLPCSEMLPVEPFLL